MTMSRDEEALFDWSAAQRDLMGGIDSTRPQWDRVWCHWLGGKDRYETDQLYGDTVLREFPQLEIADAALAHLAFQARAVRYLAGPAGLRQFLVLGPGMPAEPYAHRAAVRAERGGPVLCARAPDLSVHGAAQRIDPRCRVVYVDSDPLVMAFARAGLTSAAGTACQHVEVPCLDAGAIAEGAAQCLVPAEPVAMLVLLRLQQLTDDTAARGFVEALMAGLPSGSHLVVTHPTSVVHGDAMDRALRLFSDLSGQEMTARSPGRIVGLLGGLEVLDPGVVSVTRWRPRPEYVPPEVDLFAAVARKP